MRRFITCIFTLAVLSLSTVGLAAGENAVVTGDGVRIREAPGTTGTILTSVNKGTRLEVIEKTSVTETINGHLDTWYAVLYQGKKGYIFGQFLTLDAEDVAVPAEGTQPVQVPTLGKMTVRSEDIIGDWALYDASPPVIYTFDSEGFARYLLLRWQMEMDGDRVGRKYLTVDLVRGHYTIEGTTVRVTWFWGDTPESIFSVQKDRDGATLIIDGARIAPQFHAKEPGIVSIDDIVINTEPDL